MEKDAFYFPHDSNASSDPKCVLLVEQLGLEGYGIFWVLIETLRDQPGYKYPLILLPALARRFNTTTEKMRAVINGYGLFIVDEKEFFCSESLIRRMISWDRKRELASFAGKASARKRLEMNTGSTDVQRLFNGRSTDVQPIREEEKREEDIREDNIYIVVLDFWNSKNIIVHKKLSDKSKRKIKSLSQSYSVDDIKKSISNYETVLHEPKYYWSHTWTLEEFLYRGFERFFVDVCFENFSQKGNTSSKPQNAANFEQRKHDDKYFDNLYKDV